MMAMRSLRGLARRASTATAPSATLSPVIARHALLREDSDCDVAAFDELLRREAHAVSLADYPHARAIQSGVLVYDGATFGDADAWSADERDELLAELAAAFLEGPGIVAIVGAVPAADVDGATAVFDEIIAEQRASPSGAAGDHFAKPGANDRIWNAAEKLARRAPAAFCDYYRAPALALPAEAWLGPGYQLTAQVNRVNPGGAAQAPHRDYHLGFMTAAQAARFPRHVHAAVSPMLTLQGAVAHCDMPLESGPTLYLPHSHKYAPGYLATTREAFVEHFASRRVQLPMRKGDAIFFNPALFHAAGANTSRDTFRVANLLQLSSPLGRAMESLDRAAMCAALYPELLRRRAAAGGSDAVDGALARVVAASAEGYAFPVNLDRAPPVGGLAPPSQADLVLDALRGARSPDELERALEQHADDRLTDEV